MLFLIAAVSQEAGAADRGKILVLNVALQPLLTLASAKIQGKLNSRSDWARCLRGGAAAGALFYEAKITASHGHVRTGWIVANVAGSLASDAAAGRPAFSRVQLIAGPLRVEVSTPREENPPAVIHLSTSIAELGSLVQMNRASDRVRLRDGMVSFGKRHKYPYEGRFVDGLTWGVFPGTWDRAPEIWSHESIHAMQALQVDSVEPPLCAWLRRNCDSSKGKRFIRFRLDGGVFLGAGAYAMSRQDYVNRWTEIEAYRLAQHTPPH
jgi:hypothetical protein